MKNVKEEKKYIEENSKSKWKVFLDTFKTLGGMIGGNTSSGDRTEAEQMADEIWKNNKESLNSIEKLEKKASIPEYLSKAGKNNVDSSTSIKIDQSSENETPNKKINKNPNKKINKNPNKAGNENKKDDYVK